MKVFINKFDLRKVYFNFFRTQEGKTVFSNILSLGFLQVAGYIFPLFTMPYLARVLGVVYIGKIAFATAVTTYLQTLVDYGFNFTATRDVARKRDNKDEISKIYSSVLYCKFLLLFVALIILIVLCVFVPMIREDWVLFFMTFMLLPGYIIFPEWLFQGLEKMKFITILNLLSKFIFTVAVFVVIKSEDDYLLQPLLTACGFIVSGILSMFLIRYKLGIHIISLQKCDLVRTLKGSTDVFLNQLIPTLYNNFSIMLLGVFGGAVANGIYEAGNRLMFIIERLMNVILRAFFPFLSRNVQKHHIYAMGHFALFFMSSIILFVFSEVFIRLLFSEDFLDAVWVLRILAISFWGLGLSQIYGTNYLIVIGKEKILRNITLKNSLIGFCLSFPLIYFYGYIGAALTVCITRLLLGTNIFLKSRYLKRNLKKV